MFFPLTIVMASLTIAYFHLGLLPTWKVVPRRLLSLQHLLMLPCTCVVSTWILMTPVTKSWVFFTLLPQFLWWNVFRSQTRPALPTALQRWPRSSTITLESLRVWWLPSMQPLLPKRLLMVHPTRTGVVVVVSTTTSFLLPLVLPRLWAKSFLISTANWRKYHFWLIRFFSYLSPF